MSTAVKVVLWVLGGVVTLVLLGVGVLWWGLSGGWDGIRPAAQPEDRDVVDAREAGHEPLAVLADPTATALAEVGVDLGRAEVDQCSAGQNNWKTKDGYTLSCSQASVTGWEATGATTGAGGRHGHRRRRPAPVARVGARPRTARWSCAPPGRTPRAGTSTPTTPTRRSWSTSPRPARPTRTSRSAATDPRTRRATPQPVLDALASSSRVTVLAVVERTYFQDD